MAETPTQRIRVAELMAEGPHRPATLEMGGRAVGGDQDGDAARDGQEVGCVEGQDGDADDDQRPQGSPPAPGERRHLAHDQRRAEGVDRVEPPGVRPGRGGGGGDPHHQADHPTRPAKEASASKGCAFSQWTGDGRSISIRR